MNKMPDSRLEEVSEEANKLNCEYCGEDCDLPEEDHRSIQDARQMECQ